MTNYKSFQDKQRTKLIRQLHSLVHSAGIDNDNYREMLLAYGAASSTELSVYELTELCGKIDQMLSPMHAELNRWRKRVIKAIDAYLHLVGSVCDINIIKAVACRAAQQTDFNDIPLDRLRSLYNAFSLRCKDIIKVKESGNVVEKMKQEKKPIKQSNNNGKLTN